MTTEAQAVAEVADKLDRPELATPATFAGAIPLGRGTARALAQYGVQVARAEGAARHWSKVGEVDLAERAYIRRSFWVGQVVKLLDDIGLLHQQRAALMVYALAVGTYSPNPPDGLEVGTAGRVIADRFFGAPPD